MLKSKKAAIELSIGTMVIIVLAMSMLILGLVLIKNIFVGSTETVNELNEKVRSAVSSLFSDEGADVVVKLGSDHTARIKAGTDSFGIAIGARTPDGSSTTRERMKYTLTLDTLTQKSCYKTISPAGTEALFITSLKTPLPFDEADKSNVFARIILTIPKGTPVCTQKVYVDVKDTAPASASNPNVGSTFFVIEVQKAGIFG